jgi:hypothetical protein
MVLKINVINQMSAEDTITIQPYSDKNVLVQGNFDTHSKIMKRFQARWNPRLKVGAGWLVPIEFESAVRIHFGIEDEVEDIQVSRRFRAAPKKASKAPPREEDEDEEDDVVPELPKVSRTESKATPRAEVEARVSKSAPRAEVEAKVSKSAPRAEAKVSPRPATVKAVVQADTRSTIESDNEDIVSLARKMKDMMVRLERLER